MTKKAWRTSFREDPTIYALLGLIVIMTIFFAIINPFLALGTTILASGAVYVEKKVDKERQRLIEQNVQLAFLSIITQMQNQKNIK